MAWCPQRSTAEASDQRVLCFATVEYRITVVHIHCFQRCDQATDISADTATMIMG